MAAAHSRILRCWSASLLFLALPAYAQNATDEDADDKAASSALNAVPTVRRVQPSTSEPSLLPVGGTATASPEATTAQAQGEVSDDAKARASRSAEAADAVQGGVPARVYSDDWWSHVRPVVELHGYFRTRSEMYHNFSLGRADVGGGLWPRPLDDSYTLVDSGRGGGSTAVNLCGDNGVSPCEDKTQAFANMRLRLNPELHLSDNLRLFSQIDALDNVVLGSTPSNFGGGLTRGYGNDSQDAPTAGVNGNRNSIDIKRLWAEYVTPVGQLRFGRMPTHWGLGMLYNAGNGIDQDFQSNNDRIQFVTGLRSIDLYAGASWDFPGSGPVSNGAYNNVSGGQPYNLANRANAAQWTLFVARRTNPERQRMQLTRGDLVLNGGVYNVFRTQGLDVADASVGANTSLVNNGLERRGLNVYTVDAWLQLLWRNFRFEAEGAAHLGSVEQTASYRLDPVTGNANADSVKIRQFGFVTQTEYRAVEDKLRLQFGTGWASGDPWAESLTSDRALNNGRGPIAMFQFNPAYNVDLIFHRRLLNRVQGTYYFRPSVQYDFLRNNAGQKFGGGAAFIWTRASQFVQAPGAKRDLGAELNVQLYYQSKDGTLNDDPNQLGGFYAMLQYGAFFPLGGLQYADTATTVSGTTPNVSTAQVVRFHVGLVF